MESVFRDVRLALRRLRMAPGFTLFAVVSLALGIGVSTAVYSAVRTLFWLPLGVPHQEELVVLTSDRITNISGPDFQDVRAQQSGFKALAASARIRTALVSAEGAEVVLGEAVSGEYFAVLQLGALRGRLLTPADERESARVVVLSERFWRQHMRGDPAAVGRTIRLGGLPFEVAGIIRGSFSGLDRRRSVWIPVTAIPAAGRASFDAWGDLTDRRAAVFTVWGRLRREISPARAAGELEVIGQRLDAVSPLGRDRSAPVFDPRTRRHPARVGGDQHRRRDDHDRRRRAAAGGVLQPREPRARQGHVAIGRDRRAQRARRVPLAPRARTADRVGDRRGRRGCARRLRALSAGRLFHDRSPDGIRTDDAAAPGGKSGGARRIGGRIAARAAGVRPVAGAAGDQEQRARGLRLRPRGHAAEMASASKSGGLAGVRLRSAAARRRHGPVGDRRVRRRCDGAVGWPHSRDRPDRLHPQRPRRIADAAAGGHATHQPARTAGD